jgi:pectate lyase
MSRGWALIFLAAAMFWSGCGPAFSRAEMKPPAGRAAKVLPAFPGAEGFGAMASGGRGGRVLFVTTLEDSGSGSLREALEASGPRIVVFRVGGEIKLRRPLVIRNPDITIAGQTAPGGGVCIRDNKLRILADNVIIRHMRFRPGNTSGQAVDALSIHGARNILIDHCSFSWSVDELIGITGKSSDITIQWSFITEALNASHPKGPHAFGILVRPDSNARISLHHNLFAHNLHRNPRLGTYRGAELLTDFRNNVLYNCRFPGYGGDEGDIIRLNYRDNYVLSGPETAIGYKGVAYQSGANRPSRVHQSGNFVEGRLAGWEAFRGEIVQHAEPFAIESRNEVRGEPALDAFVAVLERGGATLPGRDSVDRRIVGDVRAGTGRIINFQAEVGGWSGYPVTTAPLDSDADGIPDAWENKMGSDPRDPSDASQEGRSGYSRLEEYLHALGG